MHVYDKLRIAKTQFNIGSGRSGQDILSQSESLLHILRGIGVYQEIGGCYGGTGGGRAFHKRVYIQQGCLSQGGRGIRGSGGRRLRQK